MRFANSSALRQRAHELIPGGCHTYAKGDDQYPQLAPGFIRQGKGCHVTDVDGNRYIEYGMGLRAVTLGHAYPAVLEAASRQMRLGNNFLRPSPVEVECAERFLDLVRGAEMVKFAKNGSDATNAAVRLARAATGREMIGICADHAFFSVDDWFIGTTEMAAGVPAAVRELTVGFRYNDLSSVRELFDRHPGRVAGLILEPEKNSPPSGGFLQGLQQLCRREGAVLIFDEMITGFRWHNGGAQTYHGVVPDLSAFGKALGNGFAISALAGRRELMRLGGLEHDRERVFLLSLTHGAENTSLAAALEVMKIYRREPVIETLWRQGRRLEEGVNRVAGELGLTEHFQLAGRPCCLVYSTLDRDGQPSQWFRALFLQELIRRGVLAPSFIVSYSHTDADIEATVEAVAGALSIYKKALADGVQQYLVGGPVKPVFRRHN